MFPLMPLEQVLKFEPLFEKYKVSEVARSPRGFLTYYKNNEVLNEEWTTKRENFIKRHLAQYNKKKTLRRALALIAWAYLPN